MAGAAAAKVIEFQRGEVCTPSEVYRFIQHLMQRNIEFAENDEEKVVGCIWGHAGISKTAVVKQLQKVGVTVNGARVYPIVKHVALAQIEEAGDISGLPYIADRQVGTDDAGNPIMERYTDYALPPWWPKEHEGHTVLLFDDFNRADPRILKAIMQILQDYKSNVGVLPRRTSIILTGNPSDEGDYLVNEIDKAMKTRIVHITMKFDKIDWANWAVANNIDQRVVSFVLAYPEQVDGTEGERTNPRSVTQFARLIKPITDLKADLRLLQQCARGTMDDTVATAFEKFVLSDYQQLVDPFEILDDYDKAIKKVESLKKGRDGQPREDLIGIIADRMFVFLMNEYAKLEEKHRIAFCKFILRTDLMPRDMMYTLLRRLRLEAQISDDAKRDQFMVDLVDAGGEELADLICDVG